MQWTHSQEISQEKWAVVEDTYGPELVAEWHNKVVEAGHTALGEPTLNAVPLWVSESGQFVEVPEVQGQPPATLRIDVIGEVNDPEGEE